MEENKEKIINWSLLEEKRRWIFIIPINKPLSSMEVLLYGYLRILDYIKKIFI